MLSINTFIDFNYEDETISLEDFYIKYGGNFKSIIITPASMHLNYYAEIPIYEAFLSHNGEYTRLEFVTNLDNNITILTEHAFAVVAYGKNSLIAKGYIFSKLNKSECVELACIIIEI